MNRFVFVSDFSKKIGGGFRDCMLLDLTRPPGDNRRAVCFIASDVAQFAEAIGAKVFQPGEWEDWESETPKGEFPKIIPALLSQLESDECECGACPNCCERDAA